ncbi:MAG: flagellar protein FlgN [Clostridiales bacterium]|jgi:flagellar biosynthesis/type III secretory pathway chaperone|nr:flagellar protein FlgN [Clostridiales bacterium]
MAGLISNLIEVLQGQVVLYQQISALSAQKKEYIIKNDIENLRKIVAEENMVVPRVMRGDKERERIMKDICMVLNKKDEDMTLSYLVTLMENQPEHAELQDIVERTKTAVYELNDINETNKALIENALEFIDYNINLIHSTFSETPVGYGSNYEEIGEQKSFLDING